jgi:hypothetical protein
VTDSRRQAKRISGVPARSSAVSPDLGSQDDDLGIDTNLYRSLRSRRLAAQRQHRRRELVKAGLERYTITADDRLPDYLIQTGRITADAALSHRAIEQALRLLVDDLVNRFFESHA